MIPMWLKLMIPGKEKTTALWLPLFLVWPLLLVLFIILIPFWIIASFIACAKGYGSLFFRAPLLLVSIFWNLQGLAMDIKSNQTRINMEFI